MKNLFDFSRTILANLIEIVLPILEAEREKTLSTRPDRKRKYVRDDGGRRKVYAVQKFLITLIYLRQRGQSHDSWADVWSECGHARKMFFTSGIPILQKLFPSQKWEAEKKWRNGAEKWSPAAVDYLLDIIRNKKLSAKKPEKDTTERKVWQVFQQ